MAALRDIVAARRAMCSTGKPLSSWHAASRIAKSDADVRSSIAFEDARRLVPLIGPGAGK
jgi:hypothetical protein